MELLGCVLAFCVGFFVVVYNQYKENVNHDDLDEFDEDEILETPEEEDEYSKFFDKDGNLSLIDENGNSKLVDENGNLMEIDDELWGKIMQRKRSK